MVGLDFNLKPLAATFNFKPSSLLQFQFESFLSPVIEPDANIETGTSFLLKFGILPETSRV